MKTFLARLVVTVIGIPLTVASIFLGNQDFFLALIAITVVMMVGEYCDMAGQPETIKWSSVVTVVAAYATSYACITGGFEVILVLSALATMLALGGELVLGKFVLKPDNPVRLILYLGLLPSFLAAIRAIPGKSIVVGFETGTGSMLVVAFFFTVWATDIFAYLIGRKLQTAKLCPSISAGKTVGGSVAGFIAAILMAIVFAVLLHKATLVLLGPVVGVFGQVGDLVESLLKRNLHKKDSGGIFPGHGGMLDRLDSMIYAAPVAYLLFRLIGF
jgi:phosphatidate cytidylyltransferase